MKRPALENKQVVVLRMAFRVRKVRGTFEKQAPGPCWEAYAKTKARTTRENNDLIG